MKPRRRTGYLDYAVAGKVIFPLLLVSEGMLSTIIDASEDGEVKLIHKLRRA
ncbi:hypothetical protein [Paenibacillus durus]|uniref:hypothetical protein n=1 Tax=Paenibacillus durus TaxID=44251 RepID=UPI0004AE65D8|nr:hypothetical protein [Paenibacillus durus]